MIKIIVIGKKTAYDKQIADYCKKLQNAYKIEWIQLPISDKNTESKNIIKNIPNNAYVILLDEIGQNINNDELNQKFCKNKNVYLIIGGPYGVDKAVKQRANFIFALGKLIYPYELVRLIIVEQIYRSQMINSNHPYHHD